MEAAVQCVVSPGGSAWVAATTRATVRASSGGMRDRRGLVAQQARDTIGHEAFLPAPDGRLADTRITHDLGRAAAVCRQQHDLCSPDVLLRSVSVRHDRVQPDTVRGTEGPLINKRIGVARLQV
jgi:hypothetical protein